MSNAKWVKLLSALSSINGLSCTAEVKLVWDDEVRDFRLDEIEFNFDFYEKSMESMISGYPRGWYDYKEIEWLKISSTNEQVINIKNLFKKLGVFETEDCLNSVKVVCYK